MTELPYLFSPISLGTMELPDRLVMPPMSVNFGVDGDGFVTEQHTAYLAARAAGGTRMITVGGGAVHPTGLDLPRMPRIWDDRFIPSLAGLARAVQGHGARIGMQLLHGGRQAYQDEKVAPSALESLGVVKGMPRALEEEEIGELIAAHGDAARRAREAGFDFVEIHGAHGYLISEFLAPISNRRTDRWGGSFENRTRFLLSVLDDIRAKVGADYPVGVRYNGDDCIAGGWTLDEAVRLAPILEAEGADWLHVSAGIYGSYPVTIPSMYAEHGCFAHLAGAVRLVATVPVIAVGRVKDPRHADQLIAEGLADMVAMGRAHLADPELAARAREGRLESIRPCIGCCRGCIDSVLRLEEATCVANPELGREHTLTGERRATDSRRVLVVGAGPAGLAAARSAARDGHRVTVVDRNPDAGGALLLAGKVPGRGEMLDLVRYQIEECARLGVELRLATELDRRLVEELGPDVAVVATGSVPDMPQVKGLFDTEMTIHTAEEILAGEAPGGDRVMVLGGDTIGLQTADFLAEGGRQVVVLQRGAHFAPEMAPNDRTSLRQRLKRDGVGLVKNVARLAVTATGATFEVDDEAETLSGYSDIVLADGRKSDRAAVVLLRASGLEPFVIGDARSPRENLYAVAEGDEIASKIRRT